ncbi:unnamed protein product [Caenorhabditis nigoni]
MFRIPPILLLLLSTLVHARDLSYFHGAVDGPKRILQDHLFMFQTALNIGDKRSVRKMFAPTNAQDEMDLEGMVAAHHDMQMEVIEAKWEDANRISGEVNYVLIRGAKAAFGVTIIKNAESPSGYKFFSFTEH